MKFKVKKTDFLSGIEKVSGIISSRSTLPIISNILIETAENLLSLISTDLEIRIKTEIPIQLEVPGKTTIPAKTLLSIVREIRDDELSIELADNLFNIRYKKGQSSLFTLPPDEFPMEHPFTSNLTFKIKQNDLLRMLRQISYAAANKEDSRKVLMGIFFSIKQGMFTAVATDGKRLALSEKQIENVSGTDGDSIIGIKTILELEKLLGTSDSEVLVEIGSSMINCKIDNTIIRGKLIEGTYPNYRQVIPASFSRNFEIKTGELVPSLRLLSLLATGPNSFIKLSIANNQLTASVTNTELGSGEEKIDIEYSGPELNVSFNPQFLMDPFKATDADKVTFKMNDGYSPVMISPGEGFVYVIMPIRK